MSEDQAATDQAPLLSPAFVWRVTTAIAILCLLTLAISFAGRIYGRQMSMVGHSDDTSLLEIVIGEDIVRLPANIIRFESERSAGAQAAVHVYFTWPGMKGYSEDAKAIFNEIDGAGELIFARLAPATMSADMSGRLEPIYRRLIEGSPVVGPAGLVSYRMRRDTGYADELLYVEKDGGDRPYAVRCLVDRESGGLSTGTGCQRDFAIGTGLSVTYRFSIDLLPQWRKIETAIRSRVETALAPAGL